MPLTNEDIISGLVSYYKRTGVDMTILLGDPTFQSMKIAEKVEAIKKYAADIHSGSKDGLTTSEKKSIMTSAAIDTGFSLVPGLMALGAHASSPRLLKGVHGKALFAAGVGGVAIGLGLSGVRSYLKYKDMLDQRSATRQNLQNVIWDPSTTNAVGVLANNTIFAQNNLARRSVIEGMIRGVNELENRPHVSNMYDRVVSDYQNQAAFDQGVNYRRPFRPTR